MVWIKPRCLPLLFSLRLLFTGKIMRGMHFSSFKFSGVRDLTDSQFLNCRFYDDDIHSGCNFNLMLLRNASFADCDLSLADLLYAAAFGLEIRECKVQIADIHDANFMNSLGRRWFFCRAYITKSNLSYCNFSRQTLEKCELMSNRAGSVSFHHRQICETDDIGRRRHLLLEQRKPLQCQVRLALQLSHDAFQHHVIISLY
ncbi:pentapeptide repeat-containing protein [Sodalis-like endosymbiont of Proechinophthirus fluctus]|uniref:pentapeptide repeat-containing protein n=1 Tax=Sodalis-like endosymbiont of Proechinophthirus fluctus TaxID=1462730 RepID=UPI000A5E84DA|nr:pentapeptide repeat-containing protein [Sodalis-like endosymbiont of Proechinophthirus fluctus]